MNLVFENGNLRPEKVVAEKWLRLIYGAENENKGESSLATLAGRKFLSRLYGAYCRSPRSRSMIGSFIAENNIDMTDCGGEFENFAQFFARRKKGVRFPAQADLMGSPCEGFASAFENIDPSAMIAAKGCKYSLDELFGAPGDSAAADLAQRYAGGVCLRLRLTPADYHRMHFFDAGEVADATYIDGDLYSVSPIAVKKIARLYCRNKRVRVELSTENFGYVTIVEVGATFVGSIVHKFLVGDIARRGREASYFLPGGSLVLIFFEKGKISPDEGILTRTCDNIETRVKVGEVIGRRFNR